MNIEIEEISPCRRKLSITVPAEEIASEYQDALKAYQQNVSIPGFRPGRAPVHLVKARHHKEIVERLRDHLLPKSYREAIEENKLEVVQIVDMDEDIQVLLDQPMTYSVTVDVKEDFTLPDYKSISLKKTPQEVTKEEVQTQIDEIREQRANFEDVKDRAVCLGDMVQIDFKSTVDGQPLNEVAPEAQGLETATDFWMQADENAFLPELGEGIPGMAIGDSRDIDVSFDDQFAVDALKGKKAVFSVTLKGIRGRVLPEVDEAFIKPFEVETVEAFKEKIKDNLLSRKEQTELARLRQEIEKFLLENTTVNLPESAVAEATDRQIRRIINNINQEGVGEDKILEQKDEIVSSAKASAETSVKLRYILHKIAEVEKIRVSDSDLKREMAMMAYAYGMQPGDLEKELKENNAREEFRGDILMRNTLQHLFDLAEIQE